MFRPYGPVHLIVCIHFFSTLFLRFLAISLCGVGVINASTYISRSLIPLWSGRLKCDPTASFLSLFLILPKCPPNLSFIVRKVWPTYCFLQRRHVMQYIRLDELHVMLVLLSCVLCVMVQLMLPLVFSLGQYLHFFGHLHLFSSIFLVVDKFVSEGDWDSVVPLSWFNADVEALKVAVLCTGAHAAQLYSFKFFCSVFCFCFILSAFDLTSTLTSMSLRFFGLW